MTFNPGFDIIPTTNPMGFQYGQTVFGPEVENRTLDSIRKSLRDPDCEGPDQVYSIAMDVGKTDHLPLLTKLHLLYGAVTYAAGALGNEPRPGRHADSGRGCCGSGGTLRTSRASSGSTPRPAA